MKKIYYLIAVSIAVISCKKNYTDAGTSTSSNTKKVRIAEVSGLSKAPSINVTGRLASKDEVLLSFKTGGIVNALKYDEGDRVNNGAMLASLNLSEINAQVQSARNGYEKAQRDYERATNMYRDTVGTLQQKQDTKTALDIATSQLEIATFNRRFSVINAPFKATILKRFVEKNQLVSPGQPIYLIGSSGKKGAQIIKLGLSDKDVVQVKLKDSSRVVFDAFAKAEYQAAVTQISEVANPTTGLYEVEITLDAYHPELKNGFIATASISPSAGDAVLKIPMNALVEGKDKKARIFYTLNEKTVQEAQVQILNLSDDYFTVTVDALPATAKVISAGAPYLKVNDTIQIVK